MDPELPNITFHIGDQELRLFFDHKYCTVSKVMALVEAMRDNRSYVLPCSKDTSVHYEPFGIPGPMCIRCSGLAMYIVYSREVEDAFRKISAALAQYEDESQWAET